MVGSGLASHGYLAEGTVTEIVGAFMVILPLAWGMWDKYRSERATQAREAVAVNVGAVVADATIGRTPTIAPARAAVLIEAIAPTLPTGVSYPLQSDTQPKEGSP